MQLVGEHSSVAVTAVVGVLTVAVIAVVVGLAWRRLQTRSLLAMLLLPAVTAAFLAGDLARTVGGRWLHPYDLEWMEGGMLAHVWRVRHGLPIYADAAPAWIPYIYPPGYTWVVALTTLIFGVDYPPARAVSVLGTLAAAGAIAYGVGRHGRGREAWVVGALAAVAFLGCYPYSGAFYDLVRPDGLCMALLGWSIVLGLEERRRYVVIAGVLLALATLTKHHSAVYGIPIALGIWARGGWREALVFTVSSVVPAFLGTVLVELLSAGRFLVYLVVVPSSHGQVAARAYPGSSWELGAALLFVLPAAAAYLPWRVAGTSPGLRRAVVVGGAVLVAFLAALYGSETSAARTPLAEVGFLKNLDFVSRPWAWLVFQLDAGMSNAGGAAHVGPLPSAIAIGSFFLGGLTCVLALGAAITGRAPVPWRYVYGGGIAIIAVVLAAVMRGHTGGFMNVLMPAHWVIALAGGVALARWDGRLPSSGPPTVGENPSLQWVGPLVGGVTLLVSIVVAFPLPWSFRPVVALVPAALAWVLASVVARAWSTTPLETPSPAPPSPRLFAVWTPVVVVVFVGNALWQGTALDRPALVPTEADRKAGDQMVEALRQSEGPVLSPFAPWLPAQAGFEPSFHLIALWDIDHKDGPYYEAVGDVKKGFREHRWGTIVDSTKSFDYEVRKSYQVRKNVLKPGRNFMGKTGWKQRPSVLLGPRAASK